MSLFDDNVKVWPLASLMALTGQSYDTHWPVLWQSHPEKPCLSITEVKNEKKSISSMAIFPHGKFPIHPPKLPVWPPDADADADA